MFWNICSGIFWIFQKWWFLTLQKCNWKLGIPDCNSNFEVLIFLGCHTSRVAYWNSKTHGEGICSIGLTIFELWPKNFYCFVMKKAIFWLFLQYSKSDSAKPLSMGLRISILNSGEGISSIGHTILKKYPKKCPFYHKNIAVFWP